MIKQYVVATLLLLFLTFLSPAGAAWALCYSSAGLKPKPGAICDDGTIYVAQHPETGTALYTTASDLSEDAQWAPTMERISAQKYHDGRENTEIARRKLFPELSPYLLKHNALNLCDKAIMNGHKDWYLPAQGELDLLFRHRFKIEGFDTSGAFPSGLYWSSTEESLLSALSVDFSVGYRINLAKQNFVSVRCVRRD